MKLCTVGKDETYRGNGLCAPDKYCPWVNKENGNGNGNGKGNRNGRKHGLRTPNEGINQRYLTKYASAVPTNLGLGFNFRPSSEGNFLSGRP
jgi:hypothetical protein